MELSLDSLEQDLLKPISPESPAGDSIRLDESFEHLDRMIKATDSLTLQTTPDWKMISVQAHQLLATQSKDILIAGYLCLSLTHALGLAGLAAALHATQMMIAQYWDSLHPEKRRARARGAALDWLMERLNSSLAGRQFDAQQRPDLQKIIATLTQMQAFCASALADHAPDIATLLRLLKQQEARLSAAESVAAPASLSSSTPSAGGISSGNGSVASSLGSTVSLGSGQVEKSDITRNAAAEPSPRPFTTEMQTPLPVATDLNSDKNFREYLRQMQAGSRVLAESMLRQDLRDPRAYEINRTMTWAAIAVLPEAKDGKTALRSVPKERLQLFQSLTDQGQHAQLIMELERSISNAPFWLDGHRMVCEALDALAAAVARQAVEQGLIGFVRRFPQLLSYSFADGTPFASSETRAWIQTLNAPEQAEGKQVQPQTGKEDFASLLQEANKLARAKAMGKALSLLQRHCHEAGTAADRFRRQLLLAEFCVQHKQSTMARALLEDLHRRMQEVSLLEWEPELSGRVMELLLTAGTREALSKQTSADPQQVLYFSRLCLVDAAKALEFQM